MRTLRETRKTVFVGSFYLKFTIRKQKNTINIINILTLKMCMIDFFRVKNKNRFSCKCMTTQITEAA